jgi:phytoene synthase
VTLDLDPDRRLALAYVPSAKRAAMAALWRLDVTLASVLATGREPMVTRIRLAWWRESLEKLDSSLAPPEPVLQAVAGHLLAAGISGAELAELEAGWTVLLTPEPLGRAALDAHAKARGGRLFRLSARLLGDDDAGVEPAGEAWALVDLARHSADEGDVRAAVAAARARAVPRLWPRPLRPLGMLAVLVREDARRGAGAWRQPGSPARMLRMLRHRLTGR